MLRNNFYVLGDQSDLRPFDTNWKKGSGATPSGLVKEVQFSIPTAPTKPQETKDFVDAESAIKC